jgi:hypothetical protein
MRDTSIDPELLEVPDDWPGALQRVSELLAEWMRNHP